MIPGKLVYLGKLVEAPKELVQDPHQFLRRTLRRQRREPDNVGKQNTARTRVIMEYKSPYDIK